jgi:hypothetical protein
MFATPKAPQNAADRSGDQFGGFVIGQLNRLKTITSALHPRRAWVVQNHPDSLWKRLTKSFGLQSTKSNAKARQKLYFA